MKAYDFVCNNRNGHESGKTFGFSEVETDPKQKILGRCPRCKKSLSSGDVVVDDGNYKAPKRRTVPVDELGLEDEAAAAAEAAAAEAANAENLTPGTGDENKSDE